MVFVMTIRSHDSQAHDPHLTAGYSVIDIRGQKYLRHDSQGCNLILRRDGELRAPPLEEQPTIGTVVSFVGRMLARPDREAS
jgi:hypothetical protein